LAWGTTGGSRWVSGMMFSVLSSSSIHQ